MTASVVDPLTVEVTFQPNADGTFRVVVGAPSWTGGDAMSAATTLLGSDATTPLATLSAGHLAFWHDYWSKVGLVELNSADGGAAYVESVRTLYLFYAASESGGPLPGSQAGLADLFDFLQDTQPWYPAGYWVWNLRMQVAANMGAGAFELNTPVFTLYRTNIPAIEAWTQSKMDVSQGILPPRDDALQRKRLLVRWRGQRLVRQGGVAQLQRADADERHRSRPLGLAAVPDDRGHDVPLRELSADERGGAVSPRQRHRRLRRAPPHDGKCPRDAVGRPGSDHRPRGDASALPRRDRGGGDPGDGRVAREPVEHRPRRAPPLPRTDSATHMQLLTAADDDAGTDVFAFSYEPAAQQHNSENLDLEAVWPYDLIGDQGPETALAQRTYAHRMFVNANDWTFDAVDAARLGLSDEVEASLTRSIQNYQSFVNGLALWASGTNNGTSEPYVEESGIVALAVNEAAVQDYDGLLRIAPALPKDWNAEGSLFIQGGSKVDFQIVGGTVVVAIVEAGSTATITARNPWPGGSASVIDGVTGATTLAATSASPLSFPTQAGHWYAIIPASAGGTIPSVNVTGTPATSKKTFGPVQIGL